MANDEHRGPVTVPTPTEPTNPTTMAWVQAAISTAVSAGVSGLVPSSRTIGSGTGLSGGGDLSANRTLAVTYGSSAATAVQGNDARVTADQAAGTASIRTLGTGAQQATAGNDSRLSDARTPTAHVHAGADINSGTVAYARLPVGTAASTIAAGDDSRITGAVQTTRQISSGTGLTGGGTLAADRTLAVAYGSASGTAVQGNDARVTADQAAGTASIRTLGTGAQQAAAGNDSRLSDARTPTSHVHAGADINSGTVAYARLPVGTAASTLAAGDDSRIVGAVQTTRQVISGTGLTGGGTLAADRTLAVAYGSSAATAVQGNDTRVVADQAAGTASIRTIGTGALQAAAGNDARFTDARTPTSHVHAGADISSGTVAYARLPVGTAASTIAAGDDARLTDQRAWSLYTAGGETSGYVPTWNGTKYVATAPTGGGGGAPSGAAGGSLSGTYPNPGLAAGSVGSTEIAAAIKDPAAATAGLRTLGTGSAQAAAGNDSRLSDARTPTAHVHAGADINSGTVAYARLPVGTASSTIAAGDDSRFTNARTPTAHAASHATGGGDAITPRSIGARLDLVPTTVKTGPYTASSGELVMVDATAGPITITLPSLALGSAVAVKKVDASANVVTVAAAAAQTIGGQAAATTSVATQYQIAELQYNSSTNWAIVGGQLSLTALDARHVLATRQVITGTGLSGGGNLTADRTLVVTYGTSAGTAAQGNDSRLSDARTPTAHVHAGADITTGTVAYARLPVGTAASTVAAGDDSRIVNARLVNQAPRTASISGNSNVDCGLAGDVQLTVTGGTPTLTPTNGQEGRAVVIECLASGGSRTVAMAGTVVLTTGISALSLVIPSGKVGVFIVRYSSLGTGVFELTSAYLRS